MVKKSLLWVYRFTLWLIAITILIVLAAALTIHFWLMPNIHQFKNDIANFATQASKQKVVIGDIKAYWQGINPHLSISNIDIYDAEERPALQLKNTNVGLSWLSIPMLEPHLSAITIRDPELTVRRVASGEIFVAGISMSAPSRPELPNWLLRQNQLVISNAKVIWLDEKRHAPELSLDNLNIELFTPLWRSLVKNHTFVIDATPSVGTSNPIHLSGNFYGNDVGHTEKWHGNINIALKDGNLAAFKPWLDYPIDLQSGTGSAEVAVKFAHHQPSSISSDVTLDNLQLQLTPTAAPLSLKKLAGKIDWELSNQGNFIGGENTNTGYAISVNDLTVSTHNGMHLQQVKGRYTQSTNDIKTLDIRLAHLDIALIQPYLLQVGLPEAVQQKITGMSAQGALDEVSLKWEASKAQTTQYQFDAKFNNLSIAPHENIPGFTNLSGTVQANEKNGELKLDSQNAKLDFKDILRWPIPADKLSGEIKWQMRGKTTTINANKVSISSPHLSGVVDASYIMDGVKGGQLNLRGKFGKGDAKYATFYYPVMLGTDTLHWLDTSILAGRAEDIDLTIKGRLADFPFVDGKNNLDPKLGLFRVTAKISDVLLEYGTGWPVIDKLGLDMLFEGKRMELNAHTGNISGNRIIKSKTTIPQLDADYPMLNIDSEVQGPVSAGIYFVNKSPVHEVTQGFTDDLKTSGNGKLLLSLKIPMQELEAAKYKGAYQITNGTLANESIPTLTQINGLLEFTENSLSAKNVKANAFGSPIAFNLSSGKDKAIRITTRGRITENSLQQLFREQNIAKASQYITGGTDWLGDIIIQKPRVNIAIRSDLSGITSHLPAPLNKGQTQAFSLRVDKKQDADTDTVTININNLVNAKIVRTSNKGKMQLDSASIHFGDITGIDNTSPNTKGLQLTGTLNYLDADAWRAVLRNLASSDKQTLNLPVQKLALKINALDIFNRRLNQLTISDKTSRAGLLPAAQGMLANVESREINGDLQWINQNNGKLIARLSSFTIPETAPDKISTATEANTQSNGQFIKLEQDYPSLDIIADNFEFNKKNFGALEVIANPQGENWNIQKLKLNTPEGIINADGQWNNWVSNPNTRLNVSWEIKDLGKTLKRFGHPDAIKDGEGTLTGNLQWPGSPHQFDTTRLSGELKFEVRKGQILQVQPGVGRLLGLLSLQSLPRRLTLDFRDLFSSGFAFDKISATVKIDKGVMRSDNFVMSGPAADVNIKGETNLQKETQHLFVKVMPRISDSVSLAALAGGPLAGAVAFLAQKILKDPLNKIVSSEYEITGTWDNPQEIKSSEGNLNNKNASPLK